MQGDNSNYFSVAQLLGMKLHGYPDTRQGWDTLVKRGKWTYREVKGLGGPGGIRREYAPPPEVQALIDARLSKPELAILSKDVFGNAPLRVAQNSNNEFDAALKRLAVATQAAVRISKQFDPEPPREWIFLIQELMAMHGLTEAGAKRVIDTLADVKKAT
jgi:hypothetical protein